MAEDKKDDKDKNKLTPLAIFGIVVAVLIAVSILSFLTYKYIYKREIMYSSKKQQEGLGGIRPQMNVKSHFEYNPRNNHNNHPLVDLSGDDY